MFTWPKKSSSTSFQQVLLGRLMLMKHVWVWTIKKPKLLPDNNLVIILLNGMFTLIIPIMVSELLWGYFKTLPNFLLPQMIKITTNYCCLAEDVVFSVENKVSFRQSLLHRCTRMHLQGSHYGPYSNLIVNPCLLLFRLVLGQCKKLLKG